MRIRNSREAVLAGNPCRCELFQPELFFGQELINLPGQFHQAFRVFFDDDLDAKFQPALFAFALHGSELVESEWLKFLVL